MAETQITEHPSPADKKLRGLALVVDDESANRLLLEKMLHLEGFEVITADNGASAVEIFSSNQIDIVFMDVMMPVMDGYEATKEIKAHAGEMFVPVIFLTALFDSDAIVKAIAYGGDDLLGKPFNFAVLKARIRAMERVRDLHRTIADKHATLRAMHERMVKDQKFAKHIFQRVLTEYYQASAYVKFLQRPADTFCGDLFLSSTLADGRIRILVADFTGHGLAAAVGSVPVADAFRHANESGLDDFSLLRLLNNRLHALLPPDIFMAACLVTLEPAGFTYWNGGMPPAYLNKLDQLIELPSKHLALGILPLLDMDAYPSFQTYDRAQTLIICTDGLIEAEDKSGRQLGESMVKSRLASAGISAPDALDIIRNTIDAHSGETVLRDDLTVAVVDLDAFCRDTATQTKKQLIKRFFVEFFGTVLAEPDLPSLMRLLTNYGPSDRDLAAIEFITTELFNNALDHGVLGLNSELKHGPDGFERYYELRDYALQHNPVGQISIKFNFYQIDYVDHRSIVLEIEVSDSGDGFEVSNWLSGDPADRAGDTTLWGRGIDTVADLCDSLKYNSKGNLVTATYSWLPQQ